MRRTWGDGRRRVLRRPSAIPPKPARIVAGRGGDAPDSRGGKGLLAAVEFVEDRTTKKNFPAALKFAATLKGEMMKRGVITRTRPAVGPHPAPGDILFFAPPLVIADGEIDRLVNTAREAVDAVVDALSA